ncbi:MAG: hypothetical protein QM668_00035 [Agriterribacter sp.]
MKKVVLFAALSILLSCQKNKDSGSSTSGLSLAGEWKLVETRSGIGDGTLTPWTPFNSNDVHISFSSDGIFNCNTTDEWHAYLKKYSSYVSDTIIINNSTNKTVLVKLYTSGRADSLSWYVLHRYDEYVEFALPCIEGCYQRFKKIN